MSLKLAQSSTKSLEKAKTPLWLDLLVLLFCIGISYLKPVPFPWKVPLIAVIIMAYIFAYYRRLTPLGMRQISLKNTLFWGFHIAVTVVVGVSNLLSP